MPLLCSSQYKPKLKEWFDKKCADDSDNRGVISGLTNTRQSSQL